MHNQLVQVSNVVTRYQIPSWLWGSNGVSLSLESDNTTKIIVIRLRIIIITLKILILFQSLIYCFLYKASSIKKSQSIHLFMKPFFFLSFISSFACLQIYFYGVNCQRSVFLYRSYFNNTRRVRGKALPKDGQKKQIRRPKTLAFMYNLHVRSYDVQ